MSASPPTISAMITWNISIALVLHTAFEVCFGRTCKAEFRLLVQDRRRSLVFKELSSNITRIVFLASIFDKDRAGCGKHCCQTGTN